MSPALRLGSYEIVRPLGVGGMAETFLAIRRGPAGFEQRVCLKRILPGYAAQRSFVVQFLDEARLLAQMHCATIVQVFDFGEVGGTYYMALELIEGIDLAVLLERCAAQSARLPTRVALYVTAQLLSALDYAHTLTANGQALHIVHRDISPSNVLLSNHGEVKLADFGIAKSRRRSYETGSGRTRGKLAYMSPEQVRGEPADARSDLFSLGVVLYEMLAGEHPFTADSEHALLSKILSCAPRPLAELCPELSSDVVRLVDRLLALEPKARCASAREALECLPSPDAPFGAQRALAELVAQYGKSPELGAAGPFSTGEKHVARTTAPLSPVSREAEPTPKPEALIQPRKRFLRRLLALGLSALALAAVTVFLTRRAPSALARRAAAVPAKTLSKAQAFPQQTAPLSEEPRGALDRPDASAAWAPQRALPTEPRTKGRPAPLSQPLDGSPAPEQVPAKGRSGVVLTPDQF